MVRLKHRYVVCQVLLNDSTQGTILSARDVVAALRSSIQTLFGDMGAGGFGNSATIKFFDDKSRIFVVRIPRESEIEVRFALTSINTINKTPLVLRTLRIAGSSRTCLQSLDELLRTFCLTLPQDEIAAAQFAYANQLQQADL